MSLPVGRVGKLPVGGQIMTPRFDESSMFRVAFALERELGIEAHRS
jgi:Asp-tRNA(Asn)/Glu-tRNA(Gln) amidotransferase A subunit family amidase